MEDEAWIKKISSEISKAIDYTSPTTRDFAVKVAAIHPGEYNIDQICYIYEYVFNRWRYVSDPHGCDYFSPASRTIELGLVGDCDDYAILMSALIEAIGGTSRIVIIEDHAYAEVYLGEYNSTDTNQILKYLEEKYNSTMHYHIDEEGGVWLNLDWTARHPGGEYQGTPQYIVYPNGWYEVCEGNARESKVSVRG